MGEVSVEDISDIFVGTCGNVESMGLQWVDSLDETEGVKDNGVPLLEDEFD